MAGCPGDLINRASQDILEDNRAALKLRQPQKRLKAAGSPE